MSNTFHDFHPARILPWLAHQLQFPEVLFQDLQLALQFLDGQPGAGLGVGVADPGGELHHPALPGPGGEGEGKVLIFLT